MSGGPEPTVLSPAPGPWARILALPPAVVLALASAVFLSLAIPAMLRDSCTYDEAIDLSSGVTYVTRRDFRLNPEHPPLSKILQALALYPFLVQEPQDDGSWEQGRAWDFAYRLLYQSGNPSGKLLFCARLPAVFWSLLLLCSVYALTRDLFGPGPALLSLGLVTACPTILAHGHLATNDLCVSTLFFLSVVSFRKLALESNVRWALYSGILLGGALGSKISSLILLPILLLGLMQARFAASAPTQGGSAWKRGVSLGIVAAAAGVATLWGLYGFRFAASPDPSFVLPWSSDSAGDGMLRNAAAWARSLRMFPDSYLYGFRFIADENASGHPAFALGHYSERGWWWYFPFAFLVKTPAGSIALIAWGLQALARRPSADRAPLDYLLTPLILYGVTAMGSGLNIGIRHLLPVYPILYVLVGGILSPSGVAPPNAWRKKFILVLLGATVLDVSIQAAHPIAFFNAPSCLLWKRHEMLVDSNLDWGQDLGRLKEYLDAQGISNIKLAYFGSGSPRALGLKHSVLPGVTSYAEYLRHEPEWGQAAELRPGDHVAISATHFAGPYLRDHEYFIRRFGRLKPVAVIGQSILLFRLPSDWK